MKMPAADRIAKRTDGARESDFFYDELMTAQPDATREFMRERLRQSAQAARPERAKKD